MKIHSIADVLIVPFVIALVYMGYQAYTQPNYPYLIWILVPIIIVILIYLFKPQMDFYWHKKFPIELDPKLKDIIQKFNPYYGSLDNDKKSEFENRLALYMEARAFKGVGSEQKDVPYDIKGILSAIPVQMTMHKKDFLIGDMDRIFIYKHPFPSPRFPFLHNVETHVEDGVIILSLEAVHLALTNPDGYYNVAWHAFVEAYLKVYKDKTDKIEAHANWETITLISNFTEKHVLEITLLKAIDPLIVICVLYFSHNEEMQNKAPEVFEAMKGFFS